MDEEISILSAAKLTFESTRMLRSSTAISVSLLRTRSFPPDTNHISVKKHVRK